MTFIALQTSWCVVTSMMLNDFIAAKRCLVVWRGISIATVAAAAVDHMTLAC